MRMMRMLLPVWSASHPTRWGNDFRADEQCRQFPDFYGIETRRFEKQSPEGQKAPRVAK